MAVVYVCGNYYRYCVAKKVIVDNMTTSSRITTRL